MPRLSDPAHWHIVTMDPRGAGRSRPPAGDDAAALNANTTAHLVTDIERLRRQLGIAGWTVYGATWGTTLAQAYAHQHCEHVKGMILASVTTASRSERDFLYGGAGDFLPEAVDAFAAGAPDGRPGLGMTEAYAPRLTCGITEVEQAAALAWCRWENGVLQLDPRAEPTGAFEDPRFRLGFARLVTHYFRDLAWLESPLLDRAGALAGLPATLINSRLDLSCPPSTTWRLHQGLAGVRADPGAWLAARNALLAPGGGDCGCGGAPCRPADAGPTDSSSGVGPSDLDRTPRQGLNIRVTEVRMVAGAGFGHWLQLSRASNLPRPGRECL